MPTLVQLRTKVRDWLATSTTRLADAYINDLVNEACKELYRDEDLRFGEVVSATVSLVQGTQGYALPGTSAFSRPVYVALLNPDNGTSLLELQERDYDEFRNLYGLAASATQGDPTDFTVFGKGSTPLLFGPTPKRTATVYVDYYEIPADLSADGDTNTITISNAWEAVLYKTLAGASVYMLDDERAGLFEQKYQTKLDQIRREHQRARHSAKSFPSMQEPG